MKQPNQWTVTYRNDVGSDDEGFWEWWEVSDGNKTFRTEEEEDAKWLADLLNRYVNCDI